MNDIVKIMFLPILLPCMAIIALLDFVIWNEPNRSWYLTARQREGPTCKPFIDETVYLQGEIRKLTDSNRMLQEQLEKERRKNK